MKNISGCLHTYMGLLQSYWGLPQTYQCVLQTYRDFLQTYLGLQQNCHVFYKPTGKILSAQKDGF